MSKKIAVVTFQLGGPDSVEAVEPFLNNLFLDPDIIDFPGAFLARKFLAKTIASRRSKPVGEHYLEIGGKSPINELTDRQVRALERLLRTRNIDARVFVAMRYWHPMTDEVVKAVKKGGYDRLILLPLYPQFSKATTYSSLNEWRRQSLRLGLEIPHNLICCYPNHHLYIEALVQNIHVSFERFRGARQEEVDLLFSAHGVPVDFIRRGDPYKLQVEETVRQVLRQGNWKSPALLCYQSKVGPSRWLEPSLHQSIRSLAAKGRKHLLVVPIAFVTEHIETLHEINIEAREEAVHLGVRQFEMMPALNDHPKFIECLADLVELRLASNSQEYSKCRVFYEGQEKKDEPRLCPWYHLSS
ncbi:MAG: ferrochelatase [Ignavibacteriales bacterium]|nr:ferrochelatase [Ignavibacteriales bacterium]